MEPNGNINIDYNVDLIVKVGHKSLSEFQISFTYIYKLFFASDFYIHTIYSV